MPRIILVSRLILEHRGRVLLLEQTARNGGKYALPGGKVEDNETPITALIRECREEANVTLLPENLELVHVLHRTKKDEVLIVMYYRTTHWHGVPTAREPKKFKEAKWFLWEHLPEHFSQVTRGVLEKYQQNISYSEHNGKNSIYRTATN